jgi:uncharacterized protein
MPEPLDLSHAVDRSRYEGRLGGDLVTQVDYTLRGNVMIISHTGTDPAFRGRGLAEQVTRYALDDVRERGLRIVPRCPYTAAFVEGHPEYADLVGR